MVKRSLALSAIVACLLVAAGCTSTSEGTPRSVPDEVPTESSEVPPSTTGSGEVELPYAGAPEVVDPLDTTRFQEDPCQSLTATQADNLNVRFPGELHDGGLGNACEFKGLSDARALVDVRFLDKYPRGLSAIYQAEKDGKWEFFYALDPVDSFPAVAFGVGQRATGGCSVAVGTSNEIIVEIVLRLSADKVGKKEPCETAALVAGMVVETMKAAQ
ncbi:MAG: DUF3558 domain-containing protein [Actinophytocola sp.]|uniref:DUF3558 domain-containing protein n=1 Tax=Actinophytocola sp. TaxID=1872138 RepID=UPI003C750C46